jgi:hypothetical protein
MTAKPKITSLNLIHPAPHFSDFISYHPYLCSLCSSYTASIAIPQTLLEHYWLRVYTLAIFTMSEPFFPVFFIAIPQFLKDPFLKHADFPVPLYKKKIPSSTSSGPLISIILFPDSSDLL